MILAMVSTGWRRVVLWTATVGFLIGPPTRPASAAPLPQHAEVRIGAHFDAAAFERTVSSRYHVAFRKVVAADIDRDGDLDVVATTDHSLVVWLNDGSGHLTSQSPKSAPAVDGASPASRWQERDLQRDEPIQDDAPSMPVLTAHAHAPPVVVGLYANHPDLAVRFHIACGSRPTRAPPA